MTLIALAHDGELVVGVVDYPALGERWWASLGYGAFHDGQPIHVSRVARLSESVICDDWRQTIAEDRNPDHPLVRVAGRCARIAPHHGHGSLAVAAGHADIAIATGSYAWDYAAPKLIVTEAGGRHTDFTGGPSLDRREALVTNSQLHGQALAVINQLDPDDRSARSPDFRNVAVASSPVLAAACVPGVSEGEAEEWAARGLETSRNSWTRKCGGLRLNLLDWPSR